MTARNIDPGHLTDAQVEAITVFAGTLLPLKDRVTHIKKTTTQMTSWNSPVN